VAERAGLATCIRFADNVVAFGPKALHAKNQYRKWSTFTFFTVLNLTVITLGQVLIRIIDYKAITVAR